LISQSVDFSVPSIANNMSTILGDRLLLIPGANTLRLLDAREGSATPHTASCGAVKAVLSYRERYL
jgi:hypothetical protein